MKYTKRAIAAIFACLISLPLYAQVIRAVDTDASNTIGELSASDYHSISADGKYAVFQTYAANITGNPIDWYPYLIFKNLTNEEIRVLNNNSEANKTATWGSTASFSKNNKYVSYALQNNDDGDTYAYYYDIKNNIEKAISTNALGQPAPMSGENTSVQITTDGNYIFYGTGESINSALDVPTPPINPWDLEDFDFYVYNTQDHTTKLFTIGTDGMALNMGGWENKLLFSKNGNRALLNTLSPRVAAGYPTSTYPEAFIYDITAGQITNTRVLSKPSTYEKLNLHALSDDGRIAISNYTDWINPATVLIHNLDNNSFEEALIDGFSSQPYNSLTLSGDGRYIFFQTDDSLVPEDQNSGSDIYVYEIATKKIKLVSITEQGVQLQGAYFGSNNPIRLERSTENGEFITFYGYGNYFDSADNSGHVFLARNPLYTPRATPAAGITHIPSTSAFGLLLLLAGILLTTFYTRRKYK